MWLSPVTVIFHHLLETVTQLKKKHKINIKQVHNTNII